MKKRNGFTLVELLAVIVILAIILVIAVPQIMKTIDNARLGALNSSVKLIAASAEREFLVQSTLNDTDFDADDFSVTCAEVAETTAADYSACTVDVDANGDATVDVTGAGKFAGYTCTDGTRTAGNCVKGS